MRITIGNLSITPNVRTYTPPTKKRKYEPLQYHQTIPYILTHVTLILPVNGTKYIFRYLSKSCDTLEQHKLTPFPDCGIQEGLSAYKAGFLIPIIPPMPATLSSGTLINHHHQSSSSIINHHHHHHHTLSDPPSRGALQGQSPVVDHQIAINAASLFSPHLLLLLLTSSCGTPRLSHSPHHHPLIRFRVFKSKSKACTPPTKPKKTEKNSKLILYVNM